MFWLRSKSHRQSQGLQPLLVLQQLLKWQQQEQEQLHLQRQQILQKQ